MFRSLFFSAALLLAGNALAAQTEQPPTGCAAKQADITAKLDAARARGDQNAVAGLQTALDKAKTHCTDDSLAQQRAQRVIDAEKEVSKREKDLRKALDKGDPEKLEKRKNKLAEARAELGQAKRALEE